MVQPVRTFRTTSRRGKHPFSCQRVLSSALNANDGEYWNFRLRKQSCRPSIQCSTPVSRFHDLSHPILVEAGKEQSTSTDSLSSRWPIISPLEIPDHFLGLSGWLVPTSSVGSADCSFQRHSMKKYGSPYEDSDCPWRWKRFQTL